MRLGTGLHITRARRPLASVPAYVPPYLDADLVIGFGLRLLRPGYTGPCIRVRRVSDGVEQNIGFDGGHLDTVALAAFLGASEGRVVTWYDQSATANHVTNATAAAQPQILSSGTPGGRAALQFFADANFDLLSQDALSPVANYSIVSAHSWEGTLARQTVSAQSRTGFPGMMIDETTGATSVSSGETPIASAGPTVAGWRYASAETQAAGPRNIIVNDSAIASGTGGEWTASDRIRLGASRTTGNNAFRGRISEYAWLVGGRSEAQRRADIANMIAYYGA